MTTNGFVPGGAGWVYFIDASTLAASALATSALARRSLSLFRKLHLAEPHLQPGRWVHPNEYMYAYLRAIVFRWWLLVVVGCVGGVDGWWS